MIYILSFKKKNINIYNFLKKVQIKICCKKQNPQNLY